jgi:hypothetical protein
LREVFAAGADSIALIKDILSPAEKISENMKLLTDLSRSG